MSSRALRKLQDDNDLLESLLSSASKKNLTSAVKKDNKANSGSNMFSLMNDNNSSDNYNETDISNEEDQLDLIETDIKKEVEEPKKITIATKSQKKKKNKLNKKKKSITKANHENNNTNSDDEITESHDDEFDQIIQQFQKRNVLEYGSMINNFQLDSDDNAIGNDDNLDVDSDEFMTASDNEDYITGKDSKSFVLSDFFFDTSFSKFPVHILKNYSWAFNTNVKNLDPHTEFKLLFDDISAESLEDIDSLSSAHISPQQLKQIQRLKRLVRNWDGQDHRTVPNGPGGSVHKLLFTKIRPDWLPTQRGELSMTLLKHEDVCDWQLIQRPTEWKDMISEDVTNWRKHISFFKFEPLNSETNKKALTEFYLSVVLHPDHESLINLISSKYPYHVPGLLQVALIMLRQGDKSNTNALIQRALFVFDRALKSGLKFNSTSVQLPFIYFYNRQFYFAIFRNIQMLSQRGAVGTASEWTKVLWSLSPLEDPVGCRYFIDQYLLLNNEYHYIIKLSNSPLIKTYRQWYTFSFGMAVVLSYLRIDESKKALKELRNVFKYHAKSLAYIFKEKLLGDSKLVDNFQVEDNSLAHIEAKAYITRFPSIWKESSDLSFLLAELQQLFTDYKKNAFDIIPEPNYSDFKGTHHPFYIDSLPVNLLRFVFLSDESSVAAAIPSNIWSDNQIYEFDVLPPESIDRETADIVEKITSFIDGQELEMYQMALLQDETLLDQIRQLSLDQYLEENPNMEIE
ncbi:hypothetical protein TPHA_0D02240 [Tetrapisispora phaffii CBS 4417]|uniref:Ribosome quality control complex subunit 1 n=1 Tax=Tetrapisispora phaffii (strain ATCC 24235 / CBS 4417 / NBRC 1672 / NRRL Y-8282 / UCD 70-5) TaxID=1071381 RepID=G8BSP1_TETPH|nr:hypothetical protein TPHA_0D02240 [Tetrapisispora phaffii CBS 4417]CCE62862.1 hypothetical protein TPHA_0D02240 [Tetrapisispora phaffii CBS 4417]